MKNIDYAKINFVLACLVISFIYGVIVGKYEIFPHEILKYARDSVVLVYQEKETLTKTKPVHFLHPARYDGNGVTVNDAPEDREELILLAGFFGDTNELRLIQRNGTIVTRWPVRFSEIFRDASHIQRPPATDWNIDTHGALILPDGSVVFTFEYGGLVKLDRCGEIIWTLPLMTHHSVERVEGGGYWVPGRRFHSQESVSPFPPFVTPFSEDTILKISEDGQVLAEISVPEIFYNNGLEAILTSSVDDVFNTGSDITHLNKIDELTSDIADDFPMFESGDLALSIRGLNMVVVINPDTGLIRWKGIGPWIRQHDPEFRSGGTIVVFNNNKYQSSIVSGSNISHVSVQGMSNIVEINPASDENKIIYGSLKGQEMFSIVRGKLELTPRGGLFITEFQGGRVFETDAAGNVIWEYINRYSSEEVAIITEARIYPESYFRVSDWTCEE